MPSLGAYAGLVRACGRVRRPGPTRELALLSMNAYLHRPPWRACTHAEERGYFQYTQSQGTQYEICTVKQPYNINVTELTSALTTGWLSQGTLGSFSSAAGLFAGAIRRCDRVCYPSLREAALVALRLFYGCSYMFHLSTRLVLGRH